MTSAKPHKRTITPEDRANIAWLWRDYLRAKMPILIVVGILVITQGVVYQQFLALTDQGLRVIFDKGALRDLIWVCAAVGGVFVYRGFTAFVVPALSARVTSDVVLGLRQTLTQHVMRLDLAFFETRPPGEFQLRLVRQSEALSVFLGQNVVRAGRDVATVIIVSIYLFYRQPMLFGAAIVMIPLVIIAMQLVARRVRVIQGRMEDATGGYIDAIEEVISGIRTVKISHREDQEANRLTDNARGLRNLNIKLLTSQATAQPFIDFAAAFVYMLVIGGGGYVVLHPAYDVDGAAIITFLLGLVLIFDPGRRLAQFWVHMQSSLLILAALRGLLNEEPAIVDTPEATDNFDPAADMAFQGVTFGYDGTDAPLFDHLDMTFQGGKTTAIVGPTGSGKTTVLSLLARLYDPQGGAVTIDGQNIKDIQLRPLREAFSIVAQDAVIFNASIADNIRYARPDATQAEIMDAAAQAELGDLLADRGDTPVGPRGTALSGGQKQRISIARAFLSAAPIVFLDEATSALDQATEEKVTAALKRLAAGRTTVMIAHRLSTVRDADAIYVMDAGHVVETGTHKGLMRQRGLYKSLFDAQQRKYRRWGL